MPDDRDVFAALTALVLERRATPEELARFRDLLRAHPEFIEMYRRQIMLATLLPALSLWESPASDAEASEEPATVDTHNPAVFGRGPFRRPAAGWRSALMVIAAALLVLATGIWFGVPALNATRHAHGGSYAAHQQQALQIVRTSEGACLDLPDALPGNVRLESGEATVRLASGVELSLLGPLDMEVCDAMQVRLASGRLLADVPPHAVGFTVQTQELELWDLGTVFGVTASNGVSDVFVFQGNVQVNERTGEAVDLCEAGQGVRAVAGRRPCKVAADFPEAAARYRSVAGRQKALRDPIAALDAADRIAALWGERRLPKVVPPPPPPVPGLRGKVIGKKEQGRGKRQSAIGNRQPSPSVEGRASSVQELSQNQAATRPPQQEESEMRGITNTAAALAAAVTMGAGAAYAVPQVTNVRMAQRAGTRVVDVLYDLAGEAAIVTLGIETNGVAIPDSAVTRLSGDVSVVIQPGTDRHIVWNAGADWPENVTETAKARVTAWSVDAPPQYCAVDVAGGPSTNSYPVYYYASAEAVPGGVTNDLYKTVHILMRQIPPTGGEGFMMGSPSNETGRDGTREDWHKVTLTKAFYAGVYEVTQSQWQQVMGDVRSWPAKWSNNDYRLTRPVEQVSYYDIRENINNTDDAAVDWPANDAVTAGSFMGRLRTKTGLAGFDLPTDAQWEYACRAGTTGALNDGTVNITNSNSDARLDLLGRYQYNGGKVWNGTAWADPTTDCTTENATAAVGSYAPNAWGLYDMHGNVWEWCLDWYVGNLGTGAVIDPLGADSGSDRVARGGGWGRAASNCRPAFRYCYGPSSRYYHIGFRLVRTLP
jgi:formylglycine-generating enzyme required for sulfatase activity/ferric-dicitrate binding protein FerR (iron transport regulator)